MNEQNSIQATLQKTSPSERVLTITVPEDQVEEAYRQAFQEKRKHLRIKGFRKGNVPDNIAKQYLSDAHLARRVINILVPPAYKQALQIHNLSPLGKPDWELKGNERGKPLLFEARLQVMPLLEIDRYKNFPIERPSRQVTTDQIEQVLYQRQQGAARYLDRSPEHQAILGDFAFIDYQAKHKGKPLPNAAVKNFLLELDHEKFLPGFVDQLVGITSGESRTFLLTLPVSYADPKLAGEEVEFEVKVHQLKERKIPDLDDAFVQQFTKLSSLDELRNTVENNLKEQLKRRTEEEIVNEIVKALVNDIHPTDVPAQLQEGHARLALRTQTAALERQGLTIEQHLADRGVSSEHFGEELSLTGLVEARLEILYRSIAAAEDIQVLKKEVDQAILAQAKANGQSPKDLKQRMLKDDTYKLLAYRLLIAKVRKALLDNAEITYLDTASKKNPVQAKSKKTAKTKKKSKSKSSKKKTTKAKSKKTTSAKKKKSKPKSKKTSEKKKSKSKSKSKKKKPSKSKARKKAKSKK